MGATRSPEDGDLDISAGFEMVIDLRIERFGYTVAVIRCVINAAS